MLGLQEPYASPARETITYSGPTRSVALPSHLPVPELLLHPMQIGALPFVMVTDADNALLALLAPDLSLRLSSVIERAQFAGNATQCSTLSGMLGCGYAMATYQAAKWLTREVRLVLDMRPHVKAMLEGECA
jgi:hypothetical protein